MYLCRSAPPVWRSPLPPSSTQRGSQRVPLKCRKISTRLNAVTSERLKSSWSLHFNLPGDATDAVGPAAVILNELLKCFIVFVKEC